MIIPELLEGHSKDIIDAFMRQQAVGQKVPDVDSGPSDSKNPSETVEEAASFDAHPHVRDDLTGPTIEEEEDDA